MKEKNAIEFVKTLYAKGYVISIADFGHETVNVVFDLTHEDDEVD